MSIVFANFLEIRDFFMFIQSLAEFSRAKIENPSKISEILAFRAFSSQLLPFAHQQTKRGPARSPNELFCRCPHAHQRRSRRYAVKRRARDAARISCALSARVEI